MSNLITSTDHLRVGDIAWSCPVIKVTKGSFYIRPTVPYGKNKFLKKNYIVVDGKVVNKKRNR